MRQLVETLRRQLPKPSRNSIANRVADALASDGVDRASITYDPDEFALRYGKHVAFLGNLYADCCMGWPWQVGKRVERFARLRLTFDEEREPFEAVRDRMLPAVRDSHMFEALNLTARAAGNEPAETPLKALGDRLALRLVVDGDESMRLVSNSDLREWGITESAAFALAAENLRRMPGGLESAGEGAYTAPWADCHVPSRLVLPEVLGSVEVSGELLAFIPNWNHLILVGLDHTAAVAGAIQFAMKVVADEPKPMSALPIVRRGGEWMTLDLPRGHALEPMLRKARVIELSSVYDDQKKLLDRVHEREGVDVFVASFSGVRNDTDRHTSYCVWGAGIVSLLPKTEEIAFFDDSRPEGAKVPARVDWDIAELHCRSLMKRTDHVLARYEVREFPSADQVERMKEAQARRDARSASDLATAD